MPTRESCSSEYLSLIISITLSQRISLSRFCELFIISLAFLQNEISSFFIPLSLLYDVTRAKIALVDSCFKMSDLSSATLLTTLYTVAIIWTTRRFAFSGVLPSKKLFTNASSESFVPTFKSCSSFNTDFSRLSISNSRFRSWSLINLTSPAPSLV